MAQRFSKDITKWINITGISRDKVVRTLAFDALDGLLRRSPVDTGRFRGSWRIGVNQADVSVLPPPKKENGKKVRINTTAIENEQRAKALGLQYGTTVHISNSLPYAIALEDGHSQQYTTGVMKDTFTELTQNLKAAIQKALKSGV